MPLSPSHRKTKLNVKFILEFKFKFKFRLSLTLKFAYAMTVCLLFVSVFPQSIPPKIIPGGGGKAWQPLKCASMALSC